MNDFTTSTPSLEDHTPKLSRKTRTRQTHLPCKTEVDLNYSHGFGVWGNERVVFSVRVDSELKKQFTWVAKAKFGSTCNAIESFMAAVVGCYQQPQLSEVYPSLTIGEIKIERNLRERRKVVVDREVTETVYERMDQNLENVKAAGKSVAVELDYSKMTVEELQRRIMWRQKQQKPTMRLAMELRRRGVLNGTQ